MLLYPLKPSDLDVPDEQLRHAEGLLLELDAPCSTLHQKGALPLYLWLKSIPLATAFNVEYALSGLFLPVHTPLAIRKRIKEVSPTVDLIAICYDKTSPPDKDWDAYCYEVEPEDALDALNWLCFLQEKARNQSVCLRGKGPFGSLFSILGHSLGASWIFSDSEAEGGLLTLIERYRVKKQRQGTALYALIGHPVLHSAGHILHNQAYETLGLDAVYFKLDLTPPQLGHALHYFKQLPIQGLSVTMPLKEHIGAHLDRVEMGFDASALNTVVVEKGKWLGLNTDARGILALIRSKQSKVKGPMVILGAGGAARGIALYAASQGYSLHIFNRSVKRAEALALDTHGKAYALSDLHLLSEIKTGILINTIPALDKALTLPLSSAWLVVEMVYAQKETPLSQLAKQKGCCFISGEEVYISQAGLQIQRWFNICAQQMGRIAEQMRSYFSSD